MNIDAHVQDLIDEGAAIALKLSKLGQAVAESHVTAELEHLFPGLTPLVAKGVVASSILGTIGTVAPEILAAYMLYKYLGGKPMDANDIALIDHDKTREMP